MASPRTSVASVFRDPSACRRPVVAGAAFVGVSLVAAGAIALVAWMQRPSVARTVAVAMAKLEDPFAALSPRAERPVPLLRATQPLFAAIRQAERLEQRGQFNEPTRRAWERAAAEVRRLGFVPVATGGGQHVQLFMKEAEEARAAELAVLLEELMPGRLAALEQDHEAAVQRDPAAAATLPPANWFRAADDAPADVRQLAMSLAAMHERATANVLTIARCREQVGYDYWRAICDAGASGTGLQARAALWQAEFGAGQAALHDAKDLYEIGFDLWRQVSVAIPELARNPIVVRELRSHQQRYEALLTTLGGTTDGDG